MFALCDLRRGRPGKGRIGSSTYHGDDILLNDGWERDQFEVEREVELVFLFKKRC